jgi:hypothetical protein
MYLVYNNAYGNIYPFCICATSTEAEEMCLALSEEDYYNNWCLRTHLGYSTHRTFSEYATSYNYKEVPFVG